MLLATFGEWVIVDSIAVGNTHERLASALGILNKNNTCGGLYFIIYL